MFLFIINYLYLLQVCGISLTRFNEFRTFWPCSFVDPLVKVANNFWKVRGLIGEFKELLRQIASGVEKTAGDSMSAKRFRTTPKVDLPHHSYIFRKTGLLGTEINNVTCSRYGTMSHLEIQKGK